MKRIIKGQTYNTDTAIEVFSDSAPDPSMAWWGLYQTRHGAFFKVLVDHDGQSTTFTPLSDPDAQALLEKHANHLVELYFGAMPEGGAAERRLTIRLPGNLVERMEEVARKREISLNSYAMRCFERCVAEDGLAAPI